jgi:hypothetical protein
MADRSKAVLLPKFFTFYIPVLWRRRGVHTDLGATPFPRTPAGSPINVISATAGRMIAASLGVLHDLK